MPSFSQELEKTLHKALDEAKNRRHEYSTLEHLLLALTEDKHATEVMDACGVKIDDLKKQLTNYLENDYESIKVPLERPEETDDQKKVRLERPTLYADKSNKEELDAYNQRHPYSPAEKWDAFADASPEPTAGFQRVVQRSILHMQSSGKEIVTGANVLVALFSERDSYAVFFLQQQDMSRLDAVSYISHGIGKGGRKRESKERRPEATQATSGEAAEGRANTVQLPAIQGVLQDLQAYDDRISTTPVLRTPHIAASIVEFFNELIIQESSAKAQKSDTSFVFGLYGPWGSGKSTLLHAVSVGLNNQHGDTVYINAWKWHGEKTLPEFILEELIRDLNKNVRGFARTLFVQMLLFVRRRYIWILAISAITIAVLLIVQDVGLRTAISSDSGGAKPVIIALLSMTAAVFSKPLAVLVERRLLASSNDGTAWSSLNIYYKYLFYISNLGKNRFRKIFFLIDDLDRCSPERVMQFMESLHFITGSGNVAVIACDDRIVSSAIYLQYKDIADATGEGHNFGIRFLEKIVQAHFRMPDLQENDLAELGLAEEAGGSPLDPKQSLPPLSTDRIETEENGHIDLKSDQVIKPDGQGSVDVRRKQHVDDVRISLIAGEVLKSIISVYGVPIRRVKMISNSVKLYTMVYPPNNPADAYRFICFIGLLHVDPDWLATGYFEERDEGKYKEYDRFFEYLGNDKEAVARLYPLIGSGSRADTVSVQFTRILHNVDSPDDLV